jgi:hypothetical protein
MNVPQQFKYLATCFHPGSEKEHATAENWIRAMVRDFLAPADRQIVKHFLDELLEGPATDDDLQQLWKGLGSGMWFSDARAFLQMIRDASASGS